MYALTAMQRLAPSIAILLCAIILMTQLVGVHAHLVYEEDAPVGFQSTTHHSHADHQHHPHGALHTVTANDDHHDSGLNLAGHVDVDSAEAPAGNMPFLKLLGFMVVCAFLLIAKRMRPVFVRRTSSPPHTQYRVWLLQPPAQAPPQSI